MPKADTTFNAIGGVMEAYKQTIEEYESQIEKLTKDRESLLQLVADLHKKLGEAQAREKKDEVVAAVGTPR